MQIERATVETGDGTSFATLGDVVVMVWSGPASLDRGNWMMDRLAQRLDQVPGSLVVIQVIESSSTPPDGEARKMGAAALSRLGPRLRRVITLPLGTDLWATLVGIVMRGVALWTSAAGSLVVVRDVAQVLAEVDRVRSPTTADAGAVQELMGELLRKTRSAPADARA